MPATAQFKTNTNWGFGIIWNLEYESFYARKPQKMRLTNNQTISKTPA